MKYLTIVFLISFILLPAFADNLTTQQIGNFVYTNGTINGQSYNASTQKIGNFEYTNGSIGNKSFNTTTQQIGNFKYTNGNFGLVGEDGDCDRWEYEKWYEVDLDFRITEEKLIH